jgi:hypothetical protein
MWAIFGGVARAESNIKSRKPKSKIAWSSDPYGFPYNHDWVTVFKLVSPLVEAMLAAFVASQSFDQSTIELPLSN